MVIAWRLQQRPDGGARTGFLLRGALRRGGSARSCDSALERRARRGTRGGNGQLRSGGNIVGTRHDGGAGLLARALRTVREERVFAMLIHCPGCD